MKLGLATTPGIGERAWAGTAAAPEGSSSHQLLLLSEWKPPRSSGQPQLCKGSHQCSGMDPEGINNQDRP